MKRIPLGWSVSEDDKPHLGGFIHGGDANTWCPEVWRRLVNDNGVRTAIDIGCGEGAALGWLRDAGVDAVGVDGSEVAIELSGMAEHIFLHDFESGPLPFWRQCDLGWCAEFVEHIAEECVGNYLPLFASCRVLAMTHANPGQDGWHHVNCQWPQYWIDALASVGMMHDLEYGYELRQITPAAHVRRSLLVFRKQA